VDIGIGLAFTTAFRGHKVLRISIIDESDQSVRLSLEGWLTGPWVEELRSQSENALAGKKTVTLDLAKVWFVDPIGAALLRELTKGDVVLVNCSTFIAQQLKERTI
jgi:ABC-type transporter Mla MlaB component